MITDEELDELLARRKPEDSIWTEVIFSGLIEIERTHEVLSGHRRECWSRYDFTMEQWKSVIWHKPYLAFADNEDGFVGCKYYNNDENDPMPFGVSGWIGDVPIVRMEFDNAIDAMKYYRQKAKPILSRMDALRSHEGHGALRDGAL